MVKRFLGSARRFLLNRINTPALVLLYHRVTRLENDPQLLAVSPANFHEQVKYLRHTHTLLPVEEFYDLLSHRKKFPRKTVVLTFDDGYADNFLEALPILQSLGSQALFYITTSNLDTDRELWWDELERIFLGNHSLPPMLEIEHKDGIYNSIAVRMRAEQLPTISCTRFCVSQRPPNAILYWITCAL